MKIIYLSTITLATLALGCGHADHDHGDHSAAEEACEHMEDEAATETVAAASESTATDTKKDDWLHRRHVVTLNAEGEESLGYLTLEVGTAGIHQLFADSPVDMTVGGIPAHSTSPVDECTTIDASYQYDLPIGEHVMFIRAEQEKVTFILEFPGD